MEQMKCPKCGGEMEEGISIDGYGDVGNFSQPSKWAKGIGRFLGVFQGQLESKKEVKTYRCTTCGYLESYTK